jgi:hypothetical protein
MQDHDGGARSHAPPAEGQGLRRGDGEGARGPHCAPLALPQHHDRQAIAEAAGCARSTVYEAIRALEQVGVLSWQNRIKRKKNYCKMWTTWTAETLGLGQEEAVDM